VFSTGKEGEGVGGRGFTANGREGTRMRKRMKKSFFTAIYDLRSTICDLRSTICYLFLYGFHRTWSRMLQGRTGTGCPSYEEEVIGQWSAVIGEEGRSSSFKFFLIQNPKFKI
jgi:hypothetical protein